MTSHELHAIKLSPNEWSALLRAVEYARQDWADSEFHAPILVALDAALTKILKVDRA